MEVERLDLVCLDRREQLLVVLLFLSPSQRTACCSWPFKKVGVPSTARRSNQSILEEISPGCSLEGLMLKLKLPILWLPDMKS